MIITESERERFYCYPLLSLMLCFRPSSFFNNHLSFCLHSSLLFSLSLSLFASCRLLQHITFDRIVQSTCLCLQTRRTSSSYHWTVFKRFFLLLFPYFLSLSSGSFCVGRFAFSLSLLRVLTQRIMKKTCQEKMSTGKKEKNEEASSSVNKARYQFETRIDIPVIWRAKSFTSSPVLRLSKDIWLWWSLSSEAQCDLLARRSKSNGHSLLLKYSSDLIDKCVTLFSSRMFGRTSVRACLLVCQWLSRATSSFLHAGILLLSSVGSSHALLTISSIGGSRFAWWIDWQCDNWRGRSVESLAINT